MIRELVLAKDDRGECGERIAKARIWPVADRTREKKLDLVRAKMEAVFALDPQTDKGRKNRAKLELAMDDFDVMANLLVEWISDEERLQLGEWMAEEDYMIHDESCAIADFVKATYRRDLLRHNIAIVVGKKIPPYLRRVRLGTAMKVSGKLSFLSEIEAIVTVDFNEWCSLTDADRQRLIHHELEHLTIGENGLQLRAHDFEEFVSVVEIYGLRSQSGRFSTDGPVADRLEICSSQLRLELDRAS